MKSLSSIGKYYRPEYIIRPFENVTIKHNKGRIKQLYQKENGLEEELIECNNLCTNKSGKVKPRKDLAVKFNSTIPIKIFKLKSDLKECFKFLKEKCETCSSLFSLQLRKARSIKTKNQNKRKAENQSLTVTS